MQAGGILQEAAGGRRGQLKVQGVQGEQCRCFLRFQPSFLLPNSLDDHLGIHAILGQLVMQGGIRHQAISWHIPQATGIGAGTGI